MESVTLGNISHSHEVATTYEQQQQQQHPHVPNGSAESDPQHSVKGLPSSTRPRSPSKLAISSSIQEEGAVDAVTDTSLSLPSNSWTVPENFSMVVDGVFRSSFPRVDNFPYLKSLGLKSVLVLIPEPYPEENMRFLEENNIAFFQVGMSGNKEPFVHVPHSVITQALEIAINPANHPILIHCNRGKHRTGCLVGCLRRLQDWSLTMIFDEYRKFSFPKSRPLDQQLIELYDDTDIYTRAMANNWLPIHW